MSGSCGHYMVIYMVLVKIWTNKGTRGCSNPTKTSPTLPCIKDLPSYILSKDGVKVNLTCPNVRKLWPLHQNFYSSSVKIWTNKGTRGCSNPTKPSPTLPCTNGLPSYILSKDGVKVNLTCPVGGKLWPLHGNLYSFSEDLDK
jgi:hypothetical protein